MRQRPHLLFRREPWASAALQRGDQRGRNLSRGLAAWSRLPLYRTRSCLTPRWARELRLAPRQCQWDLGYAPGT